ncbi:GNAT family N-acetyltransferase [Methyloraptor flagellatus]|uniref:GNAT family N-acetyltransferase n=1 Tax=Methyloraptor flagellatus TaxID=3162530 RepID=A0AAU7XB58_9HYPH
MSASGWLWWWPATPVVYEAAQPGDAARLAEIHAGSFAHEWSEPEISNFLTDPTVFGIVARRANAFGTKSAIAFGLFRHLGDEAEVLTIAVDPRYRTRGHGRGVLDAAIRRLYRDRAEALFLEVDAENTPALALYRRLGFRQVGERKGYYARPDAPPATALVMRADLR